MHKAISRALWGAFFVGGLTVLGAGAAHAADTSGEDGTASGNQVGILGDLPVTVAGNAISVLGDSESSNTATTVPGSSTAAAASTSGENAIGGGNQVVPGTVAPIVASGNAISVLGDSSSSGAQAGTATGSDADGATASTAGEDAIAGGNQVMPDVDIPIVVGGNSISVIGDSTADGAGASAAPAERNWSGDTTGVDGAASGNQVFPAIVAPVTVSGNDVSVIRDDDPFRDGLPTSGLLDAGLLETGLLDRGLIDGPLLRVGIIDDLVADPVPAGELIGVPAILRLAWQPAIAAPVIDGPVVGDVDVEVLTPVVADSAIGVEGPVVQGPDSGLTPLMATAALAPAMMLAATGVEALPLLGGIALMLATGIGLVGLKRVAHTVG